MKVLKFGGTSVGSASRIQHVADLICRDRGDIVVLSAMSGTTNALVEISEYLYKNNTASVMRCVDALRLKYEAVIGELLHNASSKAEAAAVVDEALTAIRSYCDTAIDIDAEKVILAQGELISTALMKALLVERGVCATMLPALDYMRTNENGDPDMPAIASTLKTLLKNADAADVYITQGFICRNHHGKVDNLRRGGSDYTASIVGAAIDADEIQIWTDIDGMHNNDPRYVENTSPVDHLHFEQAAELAYFGAKILHPSCILPAKQRNIPVRLLNTMKPEAQGTLIDNSCPSGAVKAIAAKDNITAIRVESARMHPAYSFMHKVFETFEDHRTPIDMIATSEVALSLAVDDDSRMPAIVDALGRLGSVIVERDMAIICIVGNMTDSECDCQARIVHALVGIPVRMISFGASRYNISVLVHADDKVAALRRLSHSLFQ